MASYLILTPPGTGRNDDRARFIADRFSGTAFFFPAIWLLTRRQWVASLFAAVLQIAAINLTGLSGLLLSGAALHLALSLLVSLEGNSFVTWSLLRKGWILQAVIPADDLETAEDLYSIMVAADPISRPQTVIVPEGDTRQRPAAGSDFALGLFDFGRSR